jgi:SAM-dependent methyltransferase
LSIVGAAYTAAAAQWTGGPARVYDRLADLLVAFSPVPLRGAWALDLGSGTGVGSRAASAAGARVIAADLSIGMLLQGRDGRPPAAVADASALPFRDAAFDVVLAPFSLNHLDRPALGVREAARVGGTLVASTYAADDDHPAKLAVERALTEVGWTRPAWYDALKTSMAVWGTVEAATAVIEQGGMTPLTVEGREILFPELGSEDIVAWRMGLAQSAAFVAALAPDVRVECVRRAVGLLGRDPEPLARRMIFLAAT